MGIIIIVSGGLVSGLGILLVIIRLVFCKMVSISSGSGVLILRFH